MSHMMRKENIQSKCKAVKYNETGAAFCFFVFLLRLTLSSAGWCGCCCSAFAPSSFSDYIFAPRKFSVPANMPWNNSHEAAAADVVLFLSGKHKNSRNSASSFHFFCFCSSNAGRLRLGLSCRPRWLWLSDAEGRTSCWWSTDTVSAVAASDWSVLCWNLPGSRENVWFCLRLSKESQRKKKNKADV